MPVAVLLNGAAVGTRLALDYESKGGGLLLRKIEDKSPVPFS